MAFCDPSSLRRYTEVEGLPHREVTALAADRGRLWIGTPGGLAVLEAGRLAPGLPEAEGPRLIHCLHLDQRGRLWAGADVGRIYCLEGEEWRVVQGADDRVENAAFCADGQGRLWVGQHPPGEVGWLEEGRFTPLRHVLEGGAASERGLMGVDAIVQDPQGRIWFGARGDERALSCFGGRQLRVFGVGDGFVKTHYIQALALGPDGALYIGTGVGLVVYQGQRFRHYTVADGLPENAINALAFDRQGRLWIGTSGGGAVCWDGQVFQVIRLGSTPGENTVNAILIDAQEQVWFGTRAGLAAYHPGTLPPRVVVRQVLAEALHREPESLACAANVPEIRIRFQGIGFKSGARQMVYSWRLRGHQNRWSRFRAESEVVYTGLTPGEYTFEVRAMDRNGLCSGPARLALTITPDPQADRIQALAGALSQGAGVAEFIGQGPAIRKVLEEMQTLAGSQVRVLVSGETGTGKGLAARAIHTLSRRTGPFIQVNCGAIPAGLVESELFGHERGAFTGATARKLGCFEVAQGGTLFLDEIGDLPLESQDALLEGLQEGFFRRVGGSQRLRAEARIVAATNRDLQQAVVQGLFRLDLFYRLNGFTLHLPPLRQRREDIPLLVEHFVRRFAQHLNRTPPTLRPEALSLLQRYTWPGNVRELEHLAQRAVLLCKGGFIEVEDLPLSVVQGEDRVEGGFVPLEEYERAYIEKALEVAGGVIYGERGAAHLLGVSPEKLRSRMRVLGISRRG
ncbi:MAG: sigma 54-interacting transcriptional regulator [Candidatus Latescibacteria bacterium]|nr:sigma 54-interacting transcriptional regulator [Candidatus Latescibacterota bacterium]